MVKQMLPGFQGWAGISQQEHVMGWNWPTPHREGKERKDQTPSQWPEDPMLVSSLKTSTSSKHKKQGLFNTWALRDIPDPYKSSVQKLLVLMWVLEKDLLSSGYIPWQLQVLHCFPIVLRVTSVGWLKRALTLWSSHRPSSYSFSSPSICLSTLHSKTPFLQ